jgi:hypothetical protein
MIVTALLTALILQQLEMERSIRYMLQNASGCAASASDDVAVLSQPDQ